MENSEIKSTKIAALLDEGEKILWYGKPELKPYVFSSYPLVLFGIPFLLFSLVWITMAIVSVVGIFIACFGLPFVLIGSSMVFSPVFNYLAYGNIEYAITTKRIFITGGLIGKDMKIIDFDKVQNISVDVTIVDQIFKLDTGSIRFYSGEVYATKNGYQSHHDSFISVKNPYEVFKFVKKVTTDIKTDIEYPNKLRPAENPGYTTEYKPVETEK